MKSGIERLNTVTHKMSEALYQQAGAAGAGAGAEGMGGAGAPGGDTGDQAEPEVVEGEIVDEKK